MLTQEGLELKIKSLIERYTIISREVRALAARVFCKRKVIVISEKGISSIPVSSRSQGVVVVLTLLLLLWISYSTGKYVTHENILSEKEREIWSTNITNDELQYELQYKMANLHRNLADLNRYFESVRQLDQISRSNVLAKNGAATNNAGDEAYRVSDAMNAQDDDLNVDIETTDVQQILSNIRSKVLSRIANLEKIVKKTGLSIDKIAANNPAFRDAMKKTAHLQNRKMAKVGKDEGGQGGPYIPMEESGIFNQDEFEAEISYLVQLEKAVSVMPLSAPLKKYYISSSFGRRMDPIRGRPAMHAGIDLSGSYKAKVYSTAPGVVKFAGNGRAYGRLIKIDHGSGISTYYAHLNRILVRKGEKVKRGQLIGLQGNSGRSTGTHLHYEVRLDGRPVNPFNFLEAGKYVF